MTIWNHKVQGRVEGTIEQVSEGGRWTYIRLTRALQVNGQEVQAGATYPFLTSLLDEDRTGIPSPAEYHVASGAPSSPDCRDENHQKCDGVAWDLMADQPCHCGCPCHA